MFRMVKEFRSFRGSQPLEFRQLCCRCLFTQHKDAKSQRIKWGDIASEKNFENPDETMHFVDFRQVNDEF